MEQARQLLENGGAVLFAFDPQTSPAGYSTNVNLIKTPLPSGFDADLLDAQLRDQLESAVGVGDLTFEDVELPAGDAVRASYTLSLNAPTGGTISLAGVQYYVAGSTGTWVLTLTNDTSTDVSSTYSTIAESLVIE